jgi:hypothetical protein
MESDMAQIPGVASGIGRRRGAARHAVDAGGAGKIDYRATAL